MARDNPISRRTALKLTGAAASTALVAGCSDDGNGNGGNGNGNGGDNSADAWEGVSEFSLVGQMSGWQGNSDPIDGIDNPTLYLTEGEEYTLTWENGDGQEHNFIIEDSEGSSLEETDSVSEEGETAELTFTASSDMAEYYCEPHPQAMRGTIEIQ